MLVFICRSMLRYWQTRTHNLLRTHCCELKCFPVCPRAQHLLRTQILCPGHKKCFWFCSETFCVRNKCFPVCARKEKSWATMCPFLPLPLGWPRMDGISQGSIKAWATPRLVSFLLFKARLRFWLDNLFINIVCSSVLSCSNLKLHQALEVKNIFKQDKMMLQLRYILSWVSINRLLNNPALEANTLQAS